MQQYSEPDIITEMAVCQSEVILEEITMAMTKDNVEMIHGYLDAITDIHLEELIKIASQPSISALVRVLPEAIMGFIFA